jgi:hypothetical protein
MFREASSLEPPTEATGSESVQHSRTEPVQAKQSDLAATESIESEISRLTWAVLDGSASAEQRGRLAALVGAQHERRRM